MRSRRVPILRVRLIAIGLPVALVCAVPCAWLVAAGDVVDDGPPAARVHGPTVADDAPGAPPKVERSGGPPTPAGVAAAAPAPARREPWVSPEVDALCRDLLPLDRSAAQAALAARFDAATDPRTRALLHQVDQRLGLDAFALHRGRAAPAHDHARPTTVVSSLDPQELQARAHRARRRRLQGAPR